MDPAECLDRVFPPEQSDFDRGERSLKPTPVVNYPVFGMTPESYAEMMDQAHTL